MKEGGFTPAPWRECASAAYPAVGGCDGVIAVIPTRNHGNWKADRALIRMSPDMYDALQDIQNHLRELAELHKAAANSNRAKEVETKIRKIEEILRQAGTGSTAAPPLNCSSCANLEKTVAGDNYCSFLGRFLTGEEGCANWTGISKTVW